MVHLCGLSNVASSTPRRRGRHRQLRKRTARHNRRNRLQQRSRNDVGKRRIKTVAPSNMLAFRFLLCFGTTQTVGTSKKVGTEPVPGSTRPTYRYTRDYRPQVNVNRPTNGTKCFNTLKDHPDRIAQGNSPSVKFSRTRHESVGARA